MPTTATGTDRSTSIGIFSTVNDLHSLAVQHEIEARGSARVHYVETNLLAERGGLTWSDSGTSRLRDTNGAWFDIAELDAIWWRRVNQPQVGSLDLDPIAEDLVHNDWRAALLGAVVEGFRGRWVSEPEATRRAENKIVQTAAAADVGLAMPRTLVSQDPPAIREFYESLNGRIVVKPVQGTRRKALATVAPGPEILDDPDALTIAPAIYQELIPGDLHLRICCFGEQVLTVEIESSVLDWRRKLDEPFRPYSDLPAEFRDRCLSLLSRLGLRMGIMDAKLGPDGEPVWIEVNPQGQFLFAEALSGTDLLNPFVDFLAAEAEAGQRRRAAATERGH